MQPTLPADVARCRPGCAELRATCARWRAEVPTYGGSIVDGAATWPLKPCAGYLPVSEYASTQRSEPERVVRPAVRGL